MCTVHKSGYMLFAIRAEWGNRMVGHVHLFCLWRSLCTSWWFLGMPCSNDAVLILCIIFVVLGHPAVHVSTSWRKRRVHCVFFFDRRSVCASEWRQDVAVGHLSLWSIAWAWFVSYYPHQSVSRPSFERHEYSKVNEARSRFQGSWAERIERGWRLFAHDCTICLGLLQRFLLVCDDHWNECYVARVVVFHVMEGTCISSVRIVMHIACR